MPRAVANIPNTVTVTNTTAVRLNLGGILTIPASAVSFVINMTLLDARGILNADNQRVRAWMALVALAKTSGPRPTAQLTIVSTSPALGVLAGNLPVLGATDYDYPGFEGAQGSDNFLHSMKP